MGFGERGRLAEWLMGHGWRADTPAAIVADASQTTQEIWTGPLSALPQAMPDAAAGAAQTMVIGEVVAVGQAIAAGISVARQTRSRHGNERGSEHTGPRTAVVCA